MKLSPLVEVAQMKHHIDIGMERLHEILLNTDFSVVMWYRICGEDFAHNVDRPDLVVNPFPDILVCLGDLQEGGEVELAFSDEVLAQLFLEEYGELMEFLLRVGALKVSTHYPFNIFLQREMKRPERRH